MSDRAIELISSYVDPSPEVDSDISQYEYTDILFPKYIMMEFIDGIGSEDFKEIYLTFINDIKQLDFWDQQSLAQAILVKILELYEFEFPITVLLDTKYQVDQVYDLIKFLEFDNITFIGDVWKSLQVDPSKVALDQYCFDHVDLVLTEITNQIKTYEFDQLISEFLRTYIKDKMIDWFISKTEKNLQLVKLRIYEQEIKHE